MVEQGSDGAVGKGSLEKGVFIFRFLQCILPKCLDVVIRQGYSSFHFVENSEIAAKILPISSGMEKFSLSGYPFPSLPPGWLPSILNCHSISFPASCGGPPTLTWLSKMHAHWFSAYCLITREIIREFWSVCVCVCSFICLNNFGHISDLSYW